MRHVAWLAQAHCAWHSHMIFSPAPCQPSPPFCTRRFQTIPSHSSPKPLHARHFQTRARAPSKQGRTWHTHTHKTRHQQRAEGRPAASARAKAPAAQCVPWAGHPAPGIAGTASWLRCHAQACPSSPCALPLYSSPHAPAEAKCPTQRSPKRRHRGESLSPLHVKWRDLETRPVMEVC